MSFPEKINLSYKKELVVPEKYVLIDLIKRGACIFGINDVDNGDRKYFRATLENNLDIVTLVTFDYEETILSTDFNQFVGLIEVGSVTFYKEEGMREPASKEVMREKIESLKEKIKQSVNKKGLLDKLSGKYGTDLSTFSPDQYPDLYNYLVVMDNLNPTKLRLWIKHGHLDNLVRNFKVKKANGNTKLMASILQATPELWSPKALFEAAKFAVKNNKTVVEIELELKGTIATKDASCLQHYLDGRLSKEDLSLIQEKELSMHDIFIMAYQIKT